MFATARHLLLALLAGGAVMVLQIVAPRMLAPHLGTGALAWTATIATFLGGLALGNAAGGRLADRGGRALLGLLFAASAGSVLLAAPLLGLATDATRGGSHGARVLAVVPAAFLPAAVLLGTLPPVLARSVLLERLRPGLALGAIAAAGALGSLAGTFFAGFEALPAWGLSGTVLACAGALGVGALSAPLGSAGRRAPPPTPGDGAAARGPWLALAFLAGAGVLAMEVVAGRMASDRLGASLATWTSVIGVVLGGLTLGALLGGTLADRLAPRRLLGGLLLLAALAAGALLWAPPLLTRVSTAPWGAVLAFLPAATVMGAISPVLIRAALGDPATWGRTVGRFYAIGTLGAVVGAVLAGGVVIPLAGLERTTLFIAFAYAAAAGVVRGRPAWPVFALLLFVALLIHGPWPEGRRLAASLGLPTQVGSLYVEDSRYGRLRVRPVDRLHEVVGTGIDAEALEADEALRGQARYDPASGALAWGGPMSEVQASRLVALGAEARAVNRLRDRSDSTLCLQIDKLVHGFVDLDDPAWLGYGYEGLYATVLAEFLPPETTLRAFFIGGGAYAFQRHLLATRGDHVRLVSAEIDPRVTAVARAWLGLFDDPRHAIVHADARTALREGLGGDGRYDLVFGDAFNHIAVPFHLTTDEFARLVKARLAPDGVYLVNVIDSLLSGRFVGAFLHTLDGVFEYVWLVSRPAPALHVRETLVVVASDRDLGLSGRMLEREGGATAYVYRDDQVRALIRRAGHRTLTDDDAPVESLLAPVTAYPRRRR